MGYEDGAQELNNDYVGGSILYLSCFQASARVIFLLLPRILLKGFLRFLWFVAIRGLGNGVSLRKTCIQ